ncbi:MAG: MvdC/MvdD family ATP grasp protein [Sciscionella sp.]
MSPTVDGACGDTVLVITADSDATAGLVTGVVEARGARVCRFDTRDFPKRVRLDAELGPQGWQGRLTTPSGAVDLAEVTAVYVRRPTAFDLPGHLSSSEVRHAGLEARFGLGGLLASLPARWCNHPAACADAAYKPRQLADFRAAGLDVPDTLLANSAEAVRRFAADHGRIVCKPIATGVLQTGDGPRAVYTRLLEPRDLADLSGVDVTAHLFQEYLSPKEFEVRLTVIGQTFLAARIDARSERARVDWRTDLSALEYQVIDTPPDVRAGVAAYMKARGLAFGCFDFVVPQQEQRNRWKVLECNAEGQWQWIAEETGLPIAESIAAWLVGDDTGHAC